VKSLSCMMLTTNGPDRAKDRDEALRSIDKSNARWPYNRILAVDQTCNIVDVCFHPLWKTVYGPNQGMARNMESGLKEINGELLFYCEDHVVLRRFPSIIALEYMFSDPLPSGKSLGYVCYNTHVLDPGQLDADGRFHRFIQDPKNYITIVGEKLLIKTPGIRDAYYTNFPAAIVRTELFKKMLQWCFENRVGKAVEPSFCEAWFALGFDQEYETAIYVLPDFQPEGKTFSDLHSSACITFVDNDPDMHARKKITTNENKGKLVW